LYEGLDDMKYTKRVSSIQIILSIVSLDQNALGYQPPLPVDPTKVNRVQKPQF
jgi:hypothetical protein